MMSELSIQHVSKPIIAPSTKYDLTYDFNFSPVARPTPAPENAAYVLDLVSSPTIVIRTSSSTISNRDFYTTWEAHQVTIDVDDWTNPRSTWRLKYGSETYWYATYGLLPSSYSATNYELVSIDHLYISANYTGQLLFDIVNGVYEADGCCVALSTGGSRSSITYEVTVLNKNTGETETVTGASTSYSVSNSPYTGNVMALYLTETLFPTRGKMKGQITMTETPI